MAAILEGGELWLTGYVGDYFFEDGFTSADVVRALAEVDDAAQLVVHINSGGGIATEGAAIHALLIARAGRTDVVVEGIAASAASLIAMAGEKVTMSAGSIMMIHDPSTYTYGTSAAHSKTIETLEALATAYARVYAAKSGKTAEQCREIMKAEWWLTPQQAVEEGFADATTETVAEAVAAFDYRIYANAPKRLVALASKKNWRLGDVSLPAVSAAQSSQTEEKSSMTDKERADKLAAELSELKAKYEANEKALAELRADKEERERKDAIMALPEAKGREAQAKVLAETKGITADAAKAILAASPAEGGGEGDDTGDLAAFEARRMNGQGLNPATGSNRPRAKGDKSVLAEAVARVNKRR